MELHNIRYFRAVAETLNFTRAAERCNVSQPALTRAIRKLEQALVRFCMLPRAQLQQVGHLARRDGPKYQLAKVLFVLVQSHRPTLKDQAYNPVEVQEDE